MSVIAPEVKTGCQSMCDKVWQCSVVVVADICGKVPPLRSVLSLTFSFNHAAFVDKQATKVCKRVTNECCLSRTLNRDGPYNVKYLYEG